jgi:hypothetical protein
VAIKYFGKCEKFAKLSKPQKLEKEKEKNYACHK